MDKAAIVFHLLLTVMLLALFPLAESHLPQPLPHPLPQPLLLPLPLPIPEPLPTPFKSPPICSSQYSLVNSACSKLPHTLDHLYSPTILASTDQPNQGHHHHSHHHSHSHSHTDTSAEEDCCRWLKEVDDVCACDLLVHLPPFLSILMHNYTVWVNEICEVTFSCGSRLIRA